MAAVNVEKKAAWMHAIVLLCAAVAFGVSSVFMQELVGAGSPLMVLMWFFCFLGLAKIAQPIYMMKVPRGLRPLRSWEVRGDVYRKLGVPGFGALLKNTPLRLLNTQVYLSRSRRELLDVCRWVESAEAIHFWSAVVLMPYIAYCVWSGRWTALAWFVVLQVVGNAYPIMHLRSVRGRLAPLCRRAAEAESRPAI